MRRTRWSRSALLPLIMRIVGLVFIFGVYPLTILWPSGWCWHPGGGRSEYLEMIMGIYATLGGFLVWAARDPVAHRSLIWFTVWSSVVHGAIMLVQAIENPIHVAHLWGDVLGLFLVALILGVVAPREKRAEP